MEPENHLFEKENHLPNLHFRVRMLVFGIHLFSGYLLGVFPKNSKFPIIDVRDRVSRWGQLGFGVPRSFGVFLGWWFSQRKKVEGLVSKYPLSFCFALGLELKFMGSWRQCVVFFCFFWRCSPELIVIQWCLLVVLDLASLHDNIWCFLNRILKGGVVIPLIFPKVPPIFPRNPDSFPSYPPSHLRFLQEGWNKNSLKTFADPIPSHGSWYICRHLVDLYC